MGPVSLFEFASRQASWLSARQSVVAANVAHADTPGFKAKDVVPFQSVLERTQMTMASTQRGHIHPAGNPQPDVVVKRDRAWEMSHSQNSVRIEQELLKAGEVNRDLALNTTVIRTFHRMLMSSLRGQN